jgi:K+-sensing histidine kinase KdpD
MKDKDATDGPSLIREDRGRKTIILIRWMLIIVVGYLIAFSYPAQSLLALPYFLFVVYTLSNLLLMFTPIRWFEKDIFIFLVLLVDIGMTSLAIFITARIDSEFFLIYFLILFIAAFTQKTKFIFFSCGLLIVGYGFFSYLKYPQLFKEPIFLLRFPFIFVISFFFATMIEAYNRVRQGQEFLKEDVRELEVLTDLAQSIGRNKNLSDFLIKVTQTLSEKLRLQRCMAILVDAREETARMVSSNDRVEKNPIVIDLKRYPALKESLLNNSGEIPEDRLLGNKTVSRYFLKKLPILYQEKNLGTLYLRVNTPHRRLIRREEYFLSRLSHITATAIYNLEKSKM